MFENAPGEKQLQGPCGLLLLKDLMESVCCHGSQPSEPFVNEEGTCLRPRATLSLSSLWVSVES